MYACTHSSLAFFGVCNFCTSRQVRIGTVTRLSPRFWHNTRMTSVPAYKHLIKGIFCLVFLSFELHSFTRFSPASLRVHVSRSLFTIIPISCKRTISIPMKISHFEASLLHSPLHRVPVCSQLRSIKLRGIS